MKVTKILAKISLYDVGQNNTTDYIVNSLSNELNIRINSSVPLTITRLIEIYREFESKEKFLVVYIKDKTLHLGTWSESTFHYENNTISDFRATHQYDFVIEVVKQCNTKYPQFLKQKQNENRLQEQEVSEPGRINGEGFAVKFKKGCPTITSRQVSYHSISTQSTE